jgi:hypothetical protein
MASRSEIGITPGTSFAGTLPANGLTPPVPGMGWPGELVPGVVSVCARQVAVPHNKTPASMHARLGPYVNLKGASLISNLAAYAAAFGHCHTFRPIPQGIRNPRARFGHERIPPKCLNAHSFQITVYFKGYKLRVT